MATVFEKRKNFFLKTEQSILHIYRAGQTFRRNHSILHGLGDTSNFKFYHFCQKFENSKWPPFLKEEKFLRIEQSILHIYSGDQKFCRNHSISHGLGDTSNFKFYHFCQKFEISKWPPFLKEENFGELSRVSCIYTTRAKNFAEISLSRTF